MGILSVSLIESDEETFMMINLMRVSVIVPVFFMRKRLVMGPSPLPLKSDKMLWISVENRPGLTGPAKQKIGFSCLCPLDHI